jgi:radial spoke head protein 9
MLKFLMNSVAKPKNSLAHRSSTDQGNQSLAQGPVFQLRFLFPEETEDGAPVPEVFREVHRLAQTIKEIDFDTATVPRGAWLVAPSHQIVENKGYEGLNYEAASNLSSYFHFREAVNLETKSAIEKQGLVRATDFLDPLSCDEPRNSWVLQRNSSKTSTSLRSLIWPGYYFFHTIETNHYGGAYFGYGQKNSDIAFML